MPKVSNSKPRRFISMPVPASTPNFDLSPPSSLGTQSRSGVSQKQTNRHYKIFDDPAVIEGYESVPLIEVDELPRGGISLETKAVGRIQFGIPPETIKDSMLMGMEVPSVYIVPVERFCREMGPALGINMAEFEFPAYFNYFVRQKRCTLVIDSLDAEQDIRSVFEETLLGPNHFRDRQHPCENVDEDFDPAFPKDARPNFYKEFLNFRTAEKSTNFQELSVSTLLDFVHFNAPCRETNQEAEMLGVPPMALEVKIESDPVLRVSDPAILHRRRPRALSGGSEDDMSISNISFEDRPRLSRRFSSTSDSRSAHSQSGNSATERRNSLGSIGSSERSESGRKKPARRTSMPTAGGSPLQGIPSCLFGENGIVERRDSLLSVNSAMTTFSSMSSRIGGGSICASNNTIYPYDFLTDDGPEMEEESNWMYSQAKWLGEIATVYPQSATEEEKKSNKTARAEIFKMAGGTEYIIHDVDKDGVIVGKVRISGTVRVPDKLSVEGFISNDGTTMEDDIERQQDFDDEKDTQLVEISVAPTFHPPSFGVTVLGNSHGFDKNGSTSGYVLWVNGRGIMVDPPPYSSAALEREGIRPQMIMAIIITHCHADHDAGTFQKVMTGSRVAIITTPTIYKSFIRKYSALSGLRSTLLRHSHRHRPAIIGQPLRFQGAVFHFTYTLHTIPCISFKVEWRGKSIVFTGDHMNIPTAIDSLEERGVLSKSRADDLRRLPVQDCDVLLHEAGAPPIHTPLSVLQALPDEVKDRLFVVHTAAIPKDSGLKVAPTGTAGTIRLDGSFNQRIQKGPISSLRKSLEGREEMPWTRPLSPQSLRDGMNQNITVLGDYNAAAASSLVRQYSRKSMGNIAPLVFLRPTDVSDAWFMLNLLSAVPFLSSLSYAHTMEILEIAHVEVYSAGQVVVKSCRRPDVLCVFWEGTCVANRSVDNSKIGAGKSNTVWHAGDWSGPVSLQPDMTKSAHVAPGDKLGDIMALSEEGVKVIVLLMKDMLRILNSGSKLFRKYAALMEDQGEQQNREVSTLMHMPLQLAVEIPENELLQVIECNSVLRNLTAMQKRLLESLAEGPKYFAPLSMIWKVGDPVDCAYLIVGGSSTVGKKAAPKLKVGRMGRRGSTGAISSNLAAIEEHDTRTQERRVGSMGPVEGDKLLQNVHPNSEYARLEAGLRIRSEEVEDEMHAAGQGQDYHPQLAQSRNLAIQAHRDKFANKVLARLYSRRAYTEHLVFSRGNFLSDTSRMVSGDLANIGNAHGIEGYGSRTSFSTVVGVTDHHSHTSNLLAGPKGCVVMVFPRSTLIPFLDSNPGLLLCLLGTQVVV